MTIYSIHNEGNKLYLEFKFDFNKIEKCREFRTKVGKWSFDWDSNLPGWKFNIELLPQVKDLFPFVYVTDEANERYTKFIETKPNESDILKLF